MAMTLSPPQVEEEREIHPHDGGGGAGQTGPGAGQLRAVKDPREEPTRTGIWVALSAIAMMFAALTSALYVREGSGTDWQRLALPPILWFNTLALVASSVTLELARRRVAEFMRRQENSRVLATAWLNATMILGLVFVVGQYAAWLKLRAAGLYLPTNPNSSFFYVFTGVHAVHVIGGLGGLLRVMVRFRSAGRGLRRSTMDATAYYWHFMGLLWIYLMFVLWAKL